MAVNVPSITVTMLGAEGSGKTTYMAGMYMVLSAGIEGYFLTAENDTDLEIEDVWMRILDGKVPPGTDKSQEYEFVFRDGLEPLLEVNWLDYRGGATRDRESTAEDTRQLLERLRRSDSIYLVLDSSKLERPVDTLTPEEWSRLEYDTRARWANGQLGQALQRPGPPPSIVVLLTKADLLRKTRFDAAAGQEHAYSSLCADVQRLLQTAFLGGAEHDLVTLVCPVWLGDFGQPEAAEGLIDASRVDPWWVHRPLLFSLMHYLHQRATSASDDQRRYEMQRTAAESRLATLQDSVVSRMFRPGRIREAAKDVERASGREGASKAESVQAGERIERIMQEMEDMYSLMFRNGRRLGGDQSLGSP